MTQKTIKLSDIYVKKSDLHIPTKTSDLTNDGNNGNSPFATLDSIPNVPIANTTASNIKMNGTQSAGSLDTYAKADHIHPSDTTKASVSHTHTSKWIELDGENAFTSGSDLFGQNQQFVYNDDIQMCMLRCHLIFGSMEANKTYTWNGSTNYFRIKQKFRPRHAVYGAANVVKNSTTGGLGTLWIDADGYLGGRFTTTLSANAENDVWLHVYSSLVWKYQG